jgi:circadian clock protein KaiC
MSKSQKKKAPVQYGTLPKALTGITGLDEITEGGLPRAGQH